MIEVLVTGANGQLASCLKDVADNYPQVHFNFFNAAELDITSKAKINKTFLNYQGAQYCINCAAYTQVDKAEEKEASKQAILVNSKGPEYLAEVCQTMGITLIHISTDFVFDGQKGSPYSENDITNPLGVYGASKLDGEIAIAKALDQHFIIRTSWLYSEFNKNFVKTMLSLAQTRTELSVVNDQIGAPTYAVDLAHAIVKIIDSKSQQFGLYHFSNKGEISWYDFASKIFELANITIDLRPVTSKEFKTLAKRPKYSVLSTLKIETNLGIRIKNWEDSLETALKRIKI